MRRYDPEDSSRRMLSDLEEERIDHHDRKYIEETTSINEVVVMKKSPYYSQYRLIRGEAIKRHCIECSAFQLKEARECWNKNAHCIVNVLDVKKN